MRSPPLLFLLHGADSSILLTASAPDTSAVEPSASTVVSDSFPPRKQSLDIGGSTGRQRRPSVSSGSQPPFANQSHPDFPASLASNAAAVSTSPRPPFLTESSNAAESYQTAQTTISPSLTPSPSALSSSLPSPSVDSILSPPQPTFYDRQQATGSPDFLLASPRSDYLPSTPKAGDSSTFAPSSSQSQQYPASAPTTPADWRTTPGGRPRVRGAKQQRLSADLDSLLGQFNEIDFGTDGDEVEKLAEKESGTLKIPTTTRLNPLVPEFSPRIVEPEPDVQEAYGGAAPLSPPLGKESAPLYSSTSTRDAPADFANDVSSRLLGVSPPLATAGRGQFALSADLSALGGLMTGLVAYAPFLLLFLSASALLTFPLFRQQLPAYVTRNDLPLSLLGPQLPPSPSSRCRLYPTGRYHRRLDFPLPPPFTIPTHRPASHVPSSR